MKSTSENEPMDVVLVDSSPEQYERLKNILPSWNLHCVSADKAKSQPDTVISENLDAIIVYARIKEEQHALKLCQRIKSVEQAKTVPLLVAINRFQMILGNDVKRLPGGHFILMPIEKEVLCQRLLSLINNSSFEPH